MFFQISKVPWGGQDWHIKHNFFLKWENIGKYLETYAHKEHKEFDTQQSSVRQKILNIFFNNNLLPEDSS